MQQDDDEPVFPSNKDGILKPKLNTDCDMCPVILPYREGQNYTLGDKFNSYESRNSDFVFLRTDQSKWNWSPTVQISCKNDHFWVKPIKGALVFKNGEKCGGHVDTQLDFDDELAFPKHRFDLPGGIASFTFEEREFVQNWNLCDKCEQIQKPCQKCEPQNATEVNFTLDNNDLIFSHILSYLPFCSLKNARLVCKDWDEHVSPIMRKKSVLNFDAESKDANPSFNFLRYSHEMEDVAPWPNWSITYPNLPSLGDDSNQWGAKYIIDLNWFLKPTRGHHVKSLKLCGKIRSNYEYGLWLKAVVQFGDTLEELRLELGLKIYDEDGDERKFVGQGKIPLPKLRRFTFEVSSLDEEESRSFANLSAGWMKNWADAIERVEYIAIYGNGALGSRFVQELGKRTYPNLSEVVLNCMAQDGIKFLAEVPLKKVRVIFALEISDLPDFENSLKKLAPSLELLSFQVSTDTEWEKLVVNLPCFPYLKTLDFHFGEFYISSLSEDGDNHENGAWHCRVRGETRVRFAFPPDDVGINYDRHLPSIRSIIVKPEFGNANADDFWTTYGDLVDSLLPREDKECCKTLLNLEIPSFDGDVEIETRYRQAYRLPEIFPNVRSEWINRLRNN